MKTTKLSDGSPTRSHRWGCLLAALVLVLSDAAPGTAQEVTMAGEAVTRPDTFWVDPAFQDDGYLRFGLPPDSATFDQVVVWFDTQLLASGEGYRRWTTSMADAPRSEMRRRAVEALKAIHRRSWAAAEPVVDSLVAAGVLAECSDHWVVNSFKCELRGGDPEVFRRVPGARMVIRGFPVLASGFRPPLVEDGPGVVEPAPASFQPSDAVVDWNLERLGITEVWRETGLTGRGVLAVFSDTGFKLDVPAIRDRVWTNDDEIPGNGLDDDGNGYVDDIHGYDFDNDTSLINAPGPANRGAHHGNSTVAIALGGALADDGLHLGVAPGARWAGVRAYGAVEAAVEWALESGADIYSMSFSLPGMAEYRSHWRKIMEHGALAGLFFVSGAGNFGDPERANHAPVPVQMRVPEDIPLAVFGVTGIGRDGVRPPFSSQGPVEWRTEHYSEGMVPKPDLALINDDLALPDTLGNRVDRIGRGNSFAAPHLTGILALMLEADPDLTPWRARSILIATGEDLGLPGFDFQYGHGLVDALEAVRRVRGVR